MSRAVEKEGAGEGGRQPPPPPPPFPGGNFFFSSKIGKRKTFICEEHARFSLFIDQDISDKK